MFYDRLFVLDPKLRALFKGDMREQGRKLMTLLKMAVNGLRNLERLVPSIEALGRRHVAHGVKDADYAVAASALLSPLKEGLGDGFTSEVEAAWTAVYQTLANVMLKAAHRAPDLATLNASPA